ncbi:MAG: CDP-alcohol phosphatidyltransferase family protein [Pseudomonadota bacterium]
MTLYAIKPAFQSVLRPLVGGLARCGVTANQVTCLAAGISVGYAGLLFAFNGPALLFALLPAVLFIRMALNAIDGMLAREHSQSSRLGAYLNEICDLISDAALILPFSLVSPFSIAWIAAIIGLAWLTEIVGILGSATGGARRYDGPMGKSDRAFVLGLLGVLVWGLGGLSSVFYWFQPLFCLSLAVTVRNRMRAELAQGGA